MGIKCDPLDIINIYSTCPQSSIEHLPDYLKRVADVAKWSEEAGCEGTLIYTDNSLIDPWLVAQVVIQSTNLLSPLVAVQPIYMHPYSVAKMVTSLANLHGRRVYLNMVAGGFRNDLLSLNDQTPHDRRYDRLTEYTWIINELLAGESPVNFKGDYFEVNKLMLKPPCPEEFLPGIFMSGSSEAGLKATHALGATAIKYPEPSGTYEGREPDREIDSGIRIGIISRDKESVAWDIAHKRFPEDRKGQLTHQLAMKVSDSVWHKQLSNLADETDPEKNPYWLTPFQNYKTFCPYLVGSHDRVAEEIARYIEAGFMTFILDIPPDNEELHHTGIVFRKAVTLSTL